MSSQEKNSIYHTELSDRNNVDWFLNSGADLCASQIMPETICDPVIQTGYVDQCNYSKTPAEDASIRRRTSISSDIILSKSVNSSISQRLSPYSQISEQVDVVSSDEEPKAISGANDTVNRCSLGKSLSERSTRSVRSLYATGTYPIGSLRVHSPSPTRSPATLTHEFLKCGDVIVTRGVDPNTIIGYDTVTLTVPQNQPFEGLRDVPVGVHLIWGSENEDSFRQGFWIISSSRTHWDYGDVIVKRWDHSSSVLDEEVSAAEIRIQQQSSPEFVHDLYPFENNIAQNVSSALNKRPTIWTDLTSSIRGSLITRITGNGWNEWLVSTTQERKPTSNIELRGENSCGLSKNQIFNFSFPHSSNRYHRGFVGRENILHATDTSGHVQAITRINCDDDIDEIIGEHQFSYLTGICLKNFSCIEYWAYLTKLFFQAFLIAVDEPKFFTKFIKAVHTQLIYDEGIKGDSILDHDEYFRDDLKNILTVFKSRLTDLLLGTGTNLTTDQKDVGKAFEDLESWLCRWNWDLRGNTNLESKESEADSERSFSSPNKLKKSSRNALKFSVGWA
ncbi:hypothetical protein Golomagni_00972 [Golovinomyces magnicellulatus]|nr:hypothetical protein Golomagni_00972 [Golovinomyces magnicellulatus]